MERDGNGQMIVEKQGMPISEIFDEYGEAYFRNLESNTINRAAEEKADNRILWRRRCHAPRRIPTI